MKLIGSVQIIFLSIILTISCESRQATSVTQISAEPTTDISRLVVRNDKGDFIKKSGWDIPTFPAEKKYKPFQSKQGGRDLELLAFSFSTSENALITLPSWGNESETTWKVHSFEEFKSEGQSPFCYGVTIGSGPLSIVYFKDEDGDGIFETYSNKCFVPAWVK